VVISNEAYLWILIVLEILIGDFKIKLIMSKSLIYFIVGCIFSIALCIFTVCFVIWKWNFSQMEVGDRLGIVLFSIAAIAINGIIVANLKYLEDEK